MENTASLLHKTEWSFEINKELVLVHPANSWVRNFFRTLYCGFNYVSWGSGVQVLTGGWGSLPSGFYCQINAGADNVNQGIVIGSSDQSWSYTDYKLISQITTVLHQICNLYPESGGNNIKIVRNFENNTGSSVTIREVGLYAFSSWGNYYYCIERTVLSSSITLNNGNLLTVTFTITP